MKKLKLGMIGTGGMAQHHIKIISDVENIEIAAVCDVSEERAKEAAEKCDCIYFTDHKELLAAKVVDAIFIVTPHYFHTTIGIDALNAGYHVLVEKPISVHKADCEKLLAAHTNKDLVFAAMFQMRTVDYYKKIKKLITDGELGEITRVNWIVTTWFRTQNYYDGGGWRATWKGEGGGVLINQCPHQLDMLTWLCGMPSEIRAFCELGKTHDIEVEDEVTAYLKFPNGASGVFITSTGETPGTDRLEICGDRGKLVFENNEIKFTRNESSMLDYIKEAKDLSKPDIWNITIPFKDEKVLPHQNIHQNFADAILNNAELIAPAAEGMNSIELGNAMLYSSLTEQTVKTPLDGVVFEEKLNELIQNSKKG